MKSYKLSADGSCVKKYGVWHEITTWPSLIIGTANIVHIIFPPFTSKTSGYYVIPHSDERELFLKYFIGGKCQKFANVFGSDVEGIFVDKFYSNETSVYMKNGDFWYSIEWKNVTKVPVPELDAKKIEWTVSTFITKNSELPFF